jgi:hypothetical protein
MNGTWRKTKLGIIEHLRWLVDDWAVRKCSQKIVGDNVGLLRVLMKHIRVLTFRALI